ncbi:MULTISPECIES: SDR family NAD(P)-dependent oxidoreductase [unclassified Iodidimonas]|uniref:SDR family NAD(P)-dependent oxidoreductase n=1 Tax=unclassified Iodidimonas TaxID=2626145 RepID=UPI0024828A60|nr:MULTISPECIES: SDR family NAD(P)-dependent oxidoreductase [unclassified Iodidimonas]
MTDNLNIAPQSRDQPPPIVNSGLFFSRFLFSFTKLGYQAHGGSQSFSYPQLLGKSILITGATGGIGAAIADLCARNGARVYGIGRNAEKLDAIARRLGPQPGDFIPLKADFSKADEIKNLLHQMTQNGIKIDALINNVGILNHRYQQTADGHDLMYAVNLLNPYRLTEGLINNKLLGDGGVIVNMASGGLYTLPQNLYFLEQSEDHFNGAAGYASHKRAMITLSDQWSQIKGIRAYSMHPGWVDTDGVQKSLPLFRRLLAAILRSPEQGADTALWLIAQRPKIVAGALWFDHKARPAHVFKQTKKPYARAADILAKLAQDAA